MPLSNKTRDRAGPVTGLSILIALSTMASFAKAKPHDPTAFAPESLAGTLAAVASNEFVQGTPLACGFQFSAAGTDSSTGSGEAVKVVGSYHLRRYAAGLVGYSLKLGIYDGLAWTRPSPPHHAFAHALRGAPPSSVSRLPGETPGYALFFGSLDESAGRVAAEVVDDGMLVVGFDRSPGRRGVVLVVDLRVAQARLVDGHVVRETSTAALDDFAACTRALLKPADR